MAANLSFHSNNWADEQEDRDHTHNNHHVEQEHDFYHT